MVCIYTGTKKVRISMFGTLVKSFWGVFVKEKKHHQTFLMRGN